MSNPLLHLLKLEEHKRKKIVYGLVAEYCIKADISEKETSWKWRTVCLSRGKYLVCVISDTIVCFGF